MTAPNDTTPLKRCSICKQRKSTGLFYKDKYAPDGLCYSCKECHAKRDGYQYTPREPLPDGYNRCGRCRRILAANTDNFHRSRNARNGFHGYCKACVQEVDSSLERKRQKTEAGRRSRSKSGRFEKRAEYFASDGYKAVKQKYLRSAKGKVTSRLHTRRRKVLGRQLPDNFTPQDWQRALDYFDGCCAACGRPPGLWHTLSPDHWIPITADDCPGTVPTNIVPLCHCKKDGTDGCNNSKCNRDADEWLIWKYGPRKAKKIIRRIQEYFEWVKNE